jgi:hypothetical protein
VATRSKMSLTKELRMLMARLEIPVSGWTCLRTGKRVSTFCSIQLEGADGVGDEAEAANRAHDAQMLMADKLTLVDVGGVGLLPGLGALLLVTGGSGGLLASLFLLSGGLSSGGLAAGGGSLLCFGRHFE